MKKIYITCSFLIISLLFTGSLRAVLSYSMIPTVVGYTPIAGGTNIPDLSAGSDLTITNPIAIGFIFRFDNINYTHFQASDNGFIHLLANGTTTLTGTGYGNASGDVVIPNNFTASNTLQPFIAPLWEELAIAGLSGGGNTSYTVTGISPARILTIQYNKVSWRAPTGTDQISFQIMLHETSNIIDFVYKVAGTLALGTLPTASIGLGGIGATNYYSLSNSGTNPTAAFNTNVTNISTKPAEGQRYRWIPTASLPIELLFFKGERTENGNILKWNTATELNNDYFTVERSSDANYFEPVTFIKGAGNSQSTKTYEYIDASYSPDNAIIYYRLKQTDFNHTTSYSPIISIDANSTNDKSSIVYYDKSINELNMTYNFRCPGIHTLKITDMSGKIIAHYPLEIISEGKSLLKISLSFHSEGLFIASLVGSKGEMLSQSKFIK